MERHGPLRLDAPVRELVLSLSAATMDRLWQTIREPAKQGRRRWGSSTPLRKSIAVRTLGDWNDPAPGYFEMDRVAHCGTSPAGSYVHSLDLKDIASGWTETRAMMVREQTLVIETVGEIRTQLPFPDAWVGCRQRQRVHVEGGARRCSVSPRQDRLQSWPLLGRSG